MKCFAILRGMQGTFRKAVLRQGTYHSPDGDVVVTADRLQHWAQQVKRVQAAGYAIPMHWDHSDSVDLLEPIKLDTLHQNKSRSAKSTVGKLVDFRVSPDGQSAELTLSTLTKRATEAASSNAVSVSPVLFSEWKDGNGITYTDTIGSIDLVDYPVDSSQGPFESVASQPQTMSCVIRMSTNPKNVYRMASEDGASDDKPFETEIASDPPSNPVGDGPDGDSEPMEAATGGTSVADVIEQLAQLSIMLPTDTTTDSFLERLRPALMTAIAARPVTEQPATALPPEQKPPEEPDVPVMADQPQIAAMSALQQRIQALESDRVSASRQKLSDRIQALLTSGRCMPTECNAKKQVLSVQKLSVGTDCNVSAGDLEVWLASREALPEGACWEPKERITKLGAKSVDAPTSYGTKNSVTNEEINEGVDTLTKRLR